MTRIARGFLALLFGLLAATPAAFAQAQRTYSQAELDQMLAPIALYPDALLSQVLMAATYPAEVSEAARWSRANPGLQGDNAVRAVEYEDWDPSVKSLVAFPQILARMDENPGWILSLGDAFLMQEPHVMDTVQQLRRRAQAAGNLQSSDQMRVRQQGQSIVVQPASPQYVYVPYYDPLVVYGPWWWPAYWPVAWAPWPGYARPYRPGAAAGFWWGTPVGLSLDFFFGNVDWHHRHVRVAHPAVYYYRPRVVVERTIVVRPRHIELNPPLAARTVPVAIRAPHPATVRSEPRPEDHRSSTRVERAQAAQVQAPPQVPHQVRMPAASAPQQPRAARHEQRNEQRNERGHKGRERS